MFSQLQRQIAFSVLIGFISLPTLAQTKTIKKIWKDGRSFVVEKTSSIDEDQEYFILDSSNKKLARARVKTCKAKSCLLTVIQNKKDFILNDTYQLVLTSKKTTTSPHGYFGYGGPLGAGVRLGYAPYKYDKWLIGGNYTFQKSTANGVNIDGHIFSAEARYPFYEIGKFKISASVELGLMKLGLKFTRDTRGPSTDVMTYVFMAGGDLAYPVTKSIDLVAKVFFAKNGMATSYSNSLGEGYSNPYGKMLISTELGVRYFF